MLWGYIVLSIKTMDDIDKNVDSISKSAMDEVNKILNLLPNKAIMKKKKRNESLKFLMRDFRNFCAAFYEGESKNSVFFLKIDDYKEDVLAEFMKIILSKGYKTEEFGSEYYTIDLS